MSDSFAAMHNANAYNACCVSRTRPRWSPPPAKPSPSVSSKEARACPRPTTDSATGPQPDRPIDRHLHLSVTSAADPGRGFPVSWSETTRRSQSCGSQAKRRPLISVGRGTEGPVAYGPVVTERIREATLTVRTPGRGRPRFAHQRLHLAATYWAPTGWRV
jgi:hypothetical protein